MKTIQKSIRIQQALHDQLGSLENSFTAGIEMATETFLLQRKSAMRKLQKKFSSEELTALCDVYNGVIFEKFWMFDPENVVAELEDAERYESLSTRLNIKLDDLIRKVRSLTETEVFFLNYEIYRFWNVSKSYGSPSPNLDNFIMAFA